MYCALQVLVNLYELTDKPEDAVEFLRKALGDTRPTNADVQQLRDNIDSSAADLAHVRNENDELRARLAAKDPESELLKPREEEASDAEAAPPAGDSEEAEAPPPTPEGEEAPAEEAAEAWRAYPTIHLIMLNFH